MYFGIIGAILGLVVSIYIRIHKQKKTKLICPREANCDKVIHSTHSTTFGIPNEVLGICYYSVVGIIYAITLIQPALLSGSVLLILTLMTIGGALFSVYLIALQGLVIRAWCMWCLGSALASALLVISLFPQQSNELFPILASQRLVWIIVHNIGFILGLGGATITDIFFFRFLQDNVITEEEKKTMDMLSSVIWVGLGTLVLSGIMLYLPEQARLDASPKFLLKLVVVSVVIVNGFLLNLRVAPRLRQLSFDNTPPATHFRRLAFALGGISVTSWYTAFLLGSFRKISLPFREGVGVYVMVLICVIIGSQIFERIKMMKVRGRF